MPYIKKGFRREDLRAGCSALIAGELNYQIFYYVKHNHNLNTIDVNYRKIKKFVDQFLGEKPNYQRYNDMTGCMLRCYREIERRSGESIGVLIDVLESYDDEIAKYEDIKISENGDVE